MKTCPHCESPYGYSIGDKLYSCPECRHEWQLEQETESIEKEGLKNPLFVSETNKGYVVDVGNQRLQALNNLNYKKVKCILYSKKNYLNYEKLKPEQCVLPDDVDLWDADIQFKEE